MIPAVLAAMSLVVLGVMNPGLILTANTPTGGDMGAHVLGPAYLRDVLLPQGRVMGWSQSWFAGFPAFYFYFPLPSLVIVALDLVLPYGVAFKIVTVLGLVGTPLAAFYLARSLRLGPVASVVTAASGVVFVFMESFSIYGGNILSTLAGEFSFSWSFAFSLVYLGLLIRSVRDDRRYIPWAALFLALTVLCHIITTIIVVLASLAVLSWKRGWRALVVWAGGFTIAAFWALPLLARIGYTSDMAWTPLTDIDQIFPLEIWILLPLAAGGAVWLARRRARVAPIVVFTLLPVAYYPLPNFLNAAFPDLFTDPRWKLWNGRLLPYWYFGVAFLAAAALGAVTTWAVRRLPERVSAWWPRAAIALTGAVALWVLVDRPVGMAVLWAVGGATLAALGFSLMWQEPVAARSVLATLAAGTLALGSLAGIAQPQGWATWNYEGYEAKEPWPEYQALMETLAGLPPGRVMWEQDSTASTGLGKYGTPMSPMLIPYWTQGDHPSMEGLYFESSLTTPFHFLNAAEMSASPSNPIPGLDYHTFQLERGVEHLQLYGVSYYVAYSDEAAQEADTISELTPVAETGPFSIYRLPPNDLVVPASFQPTVYEDPGDGVLGSFAGMIGIEGREGATFHDMALAWYDDVDTLDRWVTADGPESWPRITDISQLTTQPIEAPAGAVSGIEVSDHRVSFTTAAVGVPHLVKVSYFPNWQVTGADGPYQAAPSLMVVVPTQEEVVLEFRHGWPELLGIGLTLSGVVALGAWGITGWRRRGGGRGAAGSATGRPGSVEPV